MSEIHPLDVAADQIGPEVTETPEQPAGTPIEEIAANVRKENS